MSDLDRLWYLVMNMPGLEEEWGTLIESDTGEYLIRDDVLELIDKIAKQWRNHDLERIQGLC